MEIYNIKIVRNGATRKIYNNPFHQEGFIPKIYNVTLTKTYSSNIYDIYKCKVISGNKLIYKFAINIGYTIDDAIRITVDDFQSFKDFHRFVKFIVIDVLGENNGTKRIIYNIYDDTYYRVKIIENDKHFQRMICYLNGAKIAEVELSSNYNRDVKIYDMVKGEYIELPYNYKLNAFDRLIYHGEDEKAIKLLEEKGPEVLNAIQVCQIFIQFDPLDYDIV